MSSALYAVTIKLTAKRYLRNTYLMCSPGWQERPNHYISVVCQTHKNMYYCI